MIHVVIAEQRIQNKGPRTCLHNATPKDTYRSTFKRTTCAYLLGLEGGIVGDVGTMFAAAQYLVLVCTVGSGPVRVVSSLPALQGCLTCT